MSSITEIKKEKASFKKSISLYKEKHIEKRNELVQKILNTPKMPKWGNLKVSLIKY